LALRHHSARRTTAVSQAQGWLLTTFGDAKFHRPFADAR
jgi:hypothetical protein